MKILFVTPYNPASPSFGGALRIFHLLNQLCKYHDVTVAGFSEPGGDDKLVQEIPSLKDKVHFIDDSFLAIKEKWYQLTSLVSPHSHWYKAIQQSPLQKKIDMILEKEEFDFIQCEFPDIASHHFNSHAIKILDAHNVEYDNMQRMAQVKGNVLRKWYYRQESKKLKHDEINVCKKQGALFTTSDRDKTLFQKDVPEVPTFVIPNGVDLHYFQSTAGISEPHSIVFVGLMTYVPNYDGVTFFLDEIFPRILSKIPEATIYIVGKNPPTSISNRANKNIIVTGFVDDVRPYIEKAAVYVVPLRMGGGTRLKIVEALAMKKPIVTTHIGCEGIDVENRNTVLIADEPQHFADSVLELMRDHKLADQLTTNGYELVQQQYGWGSIGRKMDEAYRTLREMYNDQKNPSEKNKREGELTFQDFNH